MGNTLSCYLPNASIASLTEGGFLVLLLVLLKEVKVNMASNSEAPKVAYFSMEIALEASIPTYSACRK